MVEGARAPRTLRWAPSPIARDIFVSLVTSASALGRWSEQEHEHEQEKGMMSYFLYFVATVLAGTINALAGGGGLINFPSW